MNRHFFTYALSILVGLQVSCKPLQIQEIGSDPNEIQQGPDENPPEQQEVHVHKTQPETVPEPNTDAINRRYAVLSTPWDVYFRASPSILVISSLSPGIKDILKEEQKLIKAVLDSSAGTTSSSEYAELEDRLEELKTVIPKTETSAGYTRTTVRRGSYTYVVGDVAYVRQSNYSYYNSPYYSTFRQTQRSSSPEMTRSVENIAHNATLENIDQRIDALQQSIRNWTRRTSEMNPTGTSGIMRRANEAYLSGLQDYIKEFISIRADLQKIEQQQEAASRNQAQILEEWRMFETTRLPILSDYLENNASALVKPSPDGSFLLPDTSENKLLYVAEIGERTLYFELNTMRNSLHPFLLVDIDPLN